MRAEIIASALGGRRVGGGWVARCPAHDDRDPSLSIRDGDDKVLVRCHAGCEQTQVIDALRAHGLWSPNGRRRFRAPAASSSIPSRGDGDAGRTKAALAIWEAAQPAAGTLVEAYLASRGLPQPPPESLRFCPALKHPSGATWPVMLALVVRGVNGTPIGIHRTFLARDGSAKAPVEPAKMMLGPCRSGAVRLGVPDEVLMVGEGIETCLAAMQATGHTAWAALSTSGLRTLDLPEDVREIIVLADGDDPGEAAAQDCAWRWKREGLRVRIARPPQGIDFNDLLVGRRPLIEEAAR